MIKDMESTYVPNERKNKWIKLKPEYVDGVGDDLDLIILGRCPTHTHTHTPAVDACATDLTLLLLVGWRQAGIMERVSVGAAAPSRTFSSASLPSARNPQTVPASPLCTLFVLTMIDVCGACAVRVMRTRV